jgi:hypothetical protein
MFAQVDASTAAMSMPESAVLRLVLENMQDAGNLIQHFGF